jgi:hypothetical protein
MCIYSHSKYLMAKYFKKCVGRPLLYTIKQNIKQKKIHINKNIKTISIIKLLIIKIIKKPFTFTRLLLSYLVKPLNYLKRVVDYVSLSRFYIEDKLAVPYILYIYIGEIMSLQYYKRCGYCGSIFNS